MHVVSDVDAMTRLFPPWRELLSNQTKLLSQ